MQKSSTVSTFGPIPQICEPCRPFFLFFSSKSFLGSAGMFTHRHTQEGERHSFYQRRSTNKDFMFLLHVGNERAPLASFWRVMYRISSTQMAMLFFAGASPNVGCYILGPLIDIRRFFVMCITSVHERNLSFVTDPFWVQMKHLLSGKMHNGYCLMFRDISVQFSPIQQFGAICV